MKNESVDTEKGTSNVKKKVNQTPTEPEKPTDVWIEDESRNLTQNILNSINNSMLPISVKKMLLIDLMTKVVNTYDQTIAAQREAYEKSKGE